MVTFCPNDTKGQATLVLVLTVMIVSLGVGVNAARRAVSNIRRAATTQQADQAYSCAETGAEGGIYKVSNNPPDPVESENPFTGVLYDESGSAETCSYEYNIYNAVEDFDGYLSYGVDAQIPQDDVFEVNLDGYSGDVEIFWGTADTASIEVTTITGGSPPYDVVKEAYDCLGGPHDGFVQGATPPSTPENTKCSTTNITIVNPSQIMRIRPLFDAAYIVAVFKDSNVPIQGYKIVSKGVSGDVQRTLQVKVSRPQLDGIFDYVLFSGGGIEK